MSHQGYEGWFPECIVCHCPNVGRIVCLEPACHEAHGLKAVVPTQKLIAGNPQPDERLIQEANATVVKSRRRSDQSSAMHNSACTGAARVRSYDAVLLLVRFWSQRAARRRNRYPDLVRTCRMTSMSP
jgi:hypothetical protein